MVEFLVRKQKHYSNSSIRFSPELEINPADFVTAWNDSVDCKEIAEAELDSSAMNYDLGSTFVLLGGIVIGVATNTIYDLLKQTVVNNKAVQNLLAIVRTVLLSQ
ncbi:MAG: hypothetical protein IMF12_01000 [Proteobacteria bacterium]|nr:hypothetical protein [Pseudomonadota bacterium]